MKISLGLLAPSLAWEQLLRQEGVPFGPADALAGLRAAELSVVVVNRPLSRTEQECVEAYLSEGGAVLGSARHLAGIAGTTDREHLLEFLLSDPDHSFADLCLIDLGMRGMIPREANVLRTPEGTFAAFAGELHGGQAVILPFDVGQALRDTRSAVKNFYAGRDRLPSERVSVVGKGELHHLLHRSLEYLHHVRGLPYVHLWWFPHTWENVFALRLDTDRASREAVDDFYALARAHDIGFTWFLDVKSHEQWLSHFATYAGQEFGIHCYEHEVYASFEANLTNIRRGLRGMEEAGIRSSGFTAPLGEWNPSLARALEALRIPFSSEFSVAYDTFPLYPELDGQAAATLQIPIHPVSTGSLRRAGYTDEQMRAYHRMIIATKMTRREPLFFYDHPVHRTTGVVAGLLEEIRARDIESVTMGEYGSWWNRRGSILYEVGLDAGSLAFRWIQPASPADIDTVSVRISRAGSEEAIAAPAPSVSLDRLAWRKVPVFVPPADIRRIRDVDPRRILGDLYEAFVRRFR